MPENEFEAMGPAEVAAELRRLTLDYDDVPLSNVRLEFTDCDLLRRAAELLDQFSKSELRGTDDRRERRLA